MVLPHERKEELDVVVFLPDELLADSEDQAKELGSLAALHRIAGVSFAKLTAKGPSGMAPPWGLLHELDRQTERIWMISSQHCVQ